MNALVFLGDEARCAAFGLAGVAVRVVEPGGEAEAFVRACDEAAVLLVAAESAGRLPRGMLSATLEAGHPYVLILPAQPGELPAGDPAQVVRRLLGLAL